MPKWVGRVAAIAPAVTAGSVAWTSGAQAATPTISLGSAHTAVSLPSGCRANGFDRSGAFKLTPLAGMTGSGAVLGPNGSRVAFIGSTKSGETEWLQNTDGAFSETPTGVLSAAPVPVLADQIINRSGRTIRLFVQHDTVHHLAGTRLLEQIQR